MKPMINIIHHKNWKIYVERYLNPQAKSTVIFINGAMSTTVGYKSRVKALHDKVNIILFDQPFIGKSKALNQITGHFSKYDEVDVLLQLIDIYQPDYIASASWGGIATMLALAEKPKSIKKAIFSAFSTTINEKMKNYVTVAKKHIYNRAFDKVAEVINDEVGKYLPPLLKRVNKMHLSQLDEETFKQVCFHLDEVMSLRLNNYIEMLKKIEVPMVFINGEKDEYTTCEDIYTLKEYMQGSQFITIPDAGHFLDLESRAIAKQINNILIDIFTEDNPAYNNICTLSQKSVIPVDASDLYLN